MNNPAIAAIHKAAGRVQQSELFGTLPIQSALSPSVLQPHVSPDAAYASTGGFPARPVCTAVMQALRQLTGGSACSIPMTAAAFLVMCIALEEGSRSSAGSFKRNSKGEEVEEAEAEEEDTLADEGDAGDVESVTGNDDMMESEESDTFQNMNPSQIVDRLLVILDEAPATR